MSYPNAALLIDAPALAERLRSASPPLLLDVRPAHEYAGGHLPGAVHLDLWGLSLGDTDPAPLRAFLSMIEHLFALRGVTRDRGVIAYEEDSGMRAARAFWFLEYFGHPDVRVLDGGVRAWRQAGLPLETGGHAPRETEWKGEREDARLATWRDVHERLGRDDAVILDVRSDAEYRGEAVRAARGGAIPGAVHVEWKRALSPDGRFLPAGELRALFESAGVTPDREIIPYCQGGYRAAHTYLALRLLGYPRVRNYLGSWREWGNRDDLPIERPGQQS
ncbi:MAG TPA: sulfurtransferase [Vicinamibacterales bacterium]|nr:sulfurtransferase [Vicinamibacterales bacterium]